MMESHEVKLLVRQTQGLVMDEGCQKQREREREHACVCVWGGGCTCVSVFLCMCGAGGVTVCFFGGVGGEGERYSEVLHRVR